MADDFLSLLDITARRGTDQAVGLVEEAVNFAPEIDRIMGRPIPGIHYEARVRTAYTSKGAFRKVGQGSEIGSSRYTIKRFDCFFFDGQLQLDESEARAAEQNGESLAQVQADEASGVVRAKAIALGHQLYQGTLADPNGFPGLIDFLTTQMSVADPLTGSGIDQVVDAGGSGDGCERVWAIWMNPQGVHFLFGGMAGIDLNPWRFQQVTDADGKKMMAWVSNVSGFIGLSCAHVRAVGCIKNVKCGRDGTGTNPLTDKLINRLEAKFPVGLQPNLYFMSRGARASLQFDRTPSLFADMGIATAKLSGAAASIAPLPTATTSGAPIVATDSIVQETAS